MYGILRVNRLIYLNVSNIFKITGHMTQTGNGKI
jgi:hypothetical protein